MGFKRVTFTIEDETKEAIDIFRAEHDLNMSSIVNALFRFNKEGLKTYIELMCKFQELEDGIEVSENELYCTNKEESLQKIRMTSDLDMNSLNMATAQNFMNATDKKELTIEERLEIAEARINDQQNQLMRVMGISASLFASQKNYDKVIEEADTKIEEVGRTLKEVRRVLKEEDLI